jgi:hypothetical protein
MSEQQVVDTEVVAAPVVIEVANLTDEQMAAHIAALSNELGSDVTVKANTFTFKKSKDSVTGVETLRKPVVLALAYPSVNGILAILEAGGKGLELLLDSVETIVNAAARDILYTDLGLTAESFPLDKVTWETIANLPKAQRGGNGIPKEQWEDFAKDYCAVMPEATGKTEVQCANAAKILAGKFIAVKTNKDIISALVSFLETYAAVSPNIDTHMPCIEFLLSKAESLLSADDVDLLASL